MGVDKHQYKYIYGIGKQSLNLLRMTLDMLWKIVSLIQKRQDF